MKETLKPTLTAQGSTAYSRDRDIIMSQEGGETMAQNNPQQPSSSESQEVIPQNPARSGSGEYQPTRREVADIMQRMKNVPVEVRGAWKRLREEDPSFGGRQSPQGKEFSTEELSRTLLTGDPMQIGENLLGLNSSHRIKVSEIPEREAVRRRGEELPKGIQFEAYNLNTAGINDQRIINQLNSLEAYRGLPFQIAQDSIKEAFANIVALPNANPAEILTARESIAGFISEISGRAEFTEAQAEKIRNLPTVAEKIEGIKKELGNISPQNEYYSRRIIELTFGEGLQETFDYMVNKIISLPLSQETASYQLGLTAQMNLEVITSVLADAINDPRNSAHRVRLDVLSSRLSNSQESFKLLHEMNKLVRSGQLDQFLQSAGAVTPEHLNYLQRLSGVSAAMRIYEQTYDDFLTTRGWVYAEEAEDLSNKAYISLEKLNQGGALGRPLEIWELRRAHAIAGKMYNISLRSAEKIATGTVPRDLGEKEKEYKVKEFEKAIKEGRRADVDRLRKEMAEAEILGKHRYSSFPFESMGRIMNPIQLLIHRFEVGKDKSGSSMEFLKIVKKYYNEFLRSGENRTKLSINKITKLGGVKVEEMEYGGFFGVSGLYSGWRQENMFISQMKLDDRGGGVSTTVQEWLANHAPEIELAKQTKNPVKMASVLKPLIENVKAGRGILLKQAAFEGLIGYEARKLLWEKIAEENVSLMTNYLSGIKFENGVQNVPPSLIELINNVGGNINLEQFRQKIALEQEIKMRQAARALHPNLFTGQPPERVLPADFYLPSEQRLKNAIVVAGKQLASHLADIAFPYTPFLNDTFFEAFDYSVSGPEFYRRRLASDTPSFNKAEGAFTAIIDNPSVKPEEILKQLHEMQRGIESPNGRDDGQKKTFPVVEAYLEWIMTRSGERHVALKSLKQSLLKHTSEAQKYSGMEAPSVNETQTRKIIEHLEQQAVLSVKFAEELKKKKNLELAGLFFAMFRDLFTTLIPVALLYSVGKESFKAEK